MYNKDSHDSIARQPYHMSSNNIGVLQIGIILGNRFVGANTCMSKIPPQTNPVTLCITYEERNGSTFTCTLANGQECSHVCNVNMEC